MERLATVAFAFATLASLLLSQAVPAQEIPTQPTAASTGASSANATELRTTTMLMQNWKFVQDDELTDEVALKSTAADWQTISLPHTWNAQDAAGLDITKPYKRGVGWHRLEFDTPANGARKWLEIGAASIVADVWLNGRELGEHKGAFTQFRFDVTDRLAESGQNVLLVKADSSEPKPREDRTAIIPLISDFNMFGGLYRHVSLVSTLDPVHIDLGDMGGPGVYATTTSIANGDATVNVRAKVKSDSNEDADYVLRASLLDADGKSAASARRTISLKGGSRLEVSQELTVGKARLWQGIEDPYQYKLVIDLLRTDDTPIDRVVQDFGIRQMRFDPEQGFFLNGKHVPLHGVAIHQDYLGKGWAVTEKEVDESLALVREVGANAVRLGQMNPRGICTGSLVGEPGSALSSQWMSLLGSMDALQKLPRR